MHDRIRPYLGTLAYSLLGAAIGTASAVLWWYVIAPGQSRWLIGAAATACATLLLAVATQTHRIRRPRARRRAHARTRPTTRKAA